MVELNGKKILVTFLMHLGDLTLTTPFSMSMTSSVSPPMTQPATLPVFGVML